MIPQSLFALLALTRLGAIHAVVFGGFSPAALAQRIDSAEPVSILTASCGIEGSKGPTAYAPMIRGAIEKSHWKPRKVLVWQREELAWEVDGGRGEADWGVLVEGARKRGVGADAVPVKSGEGVYIIYTSGTTGMLLMRRKVYSALVLTDTFCRATKRCVTRDRRSPSRSEPVDTADHGHPRARRRHVLCLRHRVGGRPLVHPLRALARRRNNSTIRGQARRNARRRHILADLEGV